MEALHEAEAARAQPTEIWDEPAPEPAAVAEAAGAADEAAAADAVAADAIRSDPEETVVVEESPEPTAVPPAGVPPTAFEDTQPIDVVSEDLLVAEDEDASTGEIAAAEASALVAGGGVPGEAPAQEPAEESAAEAEAAAASLTLLQRGVDLLNVSRVPRKIAETNEQLGLPHVHVASNGEVVAVTFMWTMGWYRFDVDLDSGDVRMDDRGYEELSLPPNAGVRADGTVQLAPAQISRAAAQRAQSSAEAAPAQPEPARPAAEPAEPETPREAAQKPPEFLSKSLLGQRSDDESASWEQTQARDFDWDR
jgi:hypothetical protein